MDMEKYRTLVSVIEEGSFSALAEKQGYTPSGISRMMASMEAELGFPLLIRSKKGVTPTADCLEILPQIKNALAAWERVRQSADQLLGLSTGTLHIGTSYYAGYPWLAQVIAAFQKQYPGIAVKLIEGTSSQLAIAIEENRADLCLISQRAGNHQWILLKKDFMVAWVPKDHPMAGGAGFPISQFRKEPFIELYPGLETDNSRMFHRNSIQPQTVYTTTDNFAVYAMVAAGLGISSANSLIAESFAGDVVALPIEPLQSVDIGMAIPAESVISPAARKFADFAISRAGQWSETR